MSDTLRAIILGIVEGLTEFLPVSSTGHMILTEPLLGIAQEDRFWKVTFDIFIQSGAILAVVLLFWKRLWRLTFRGAAGPWYEHISVKLFVAFLPAAVVGLLFHDLIEQHLKTPAVVAGALIAGGFAIIAIERGVRRPTHDDAGTIPLRIALAIGVAQCLAMIPGTSRSAATIMGALLLGLTPAAAAEFSFFLAIPTIFAASGYSLLKDIRNIHSQELVLLGIGFAVSFVVAAVVVTGFMRFIRTHTFTSFAIYRIVLGVIVIAAIRYGWPL